MDIDLGNLSTAELLAYAEANMSVRRQAEVDQLLLALEWCDRFGHDPQDRPGSVPATKGGDRLIQLGGDGTPMVAELCLGELAIAFHAGVIATHNLVAAALDLRHRFPLLWAEVQNLRCPVWIARKITVMARNLALAACELVDQAVTDAVDESPGRLERIAEAKIIEADLEAHQARVMADATKTGCWLARPRPGDILDPSGPDGGYAATRRISARLPAGVAVELDTTLDDLADALAAQADPDEEPATRAELRAQALALLADPHAAVRFLDGPEPAPEPAPDPAPEPTPTPAPRRPRRPRRQAVIHVHLSALALAGVLPGVSRAEGLGPFLLNQLRDLLGGREITVQPVLDLAAVTSINAYEHPTLVRDRAVARMNGDTFPHSTGDGGVSGRYDLDHPAPYRSDGPPGQTSDHNAAPLTRRHHRIKTHGHGYQVKQIGLNAYRWVTPHGLARVVTPRGTTTVTLARAPDGTILGEYYPNPPGLTITIDRAGFSAG